jgi:hypothetical protein
VKELYTDSVEPITLQIWYSQEPVPSETPVTVDIQSKDGTSLAGGTASGPDANNVYSFTVPANLLDSEAEYLIKWDYTVSGAALSKTERLRVVTPYILPEDFVGAFPGFEGISYSSLKDMERSVRYTINAFCGQSFSLETEKTHTLTISHLGYIYLPQRLVTVRNAYTGYANVTKYVRADATGFLLYYPTMDGWVDVKADIGMPGSPRLFYEGQSLAIYGDWGWDHVPQEVQHAAKLLMARYLEPESEWHRNRVEAVNMSDHTVRFTGNPYASTGDIQVDQILEGYKLFQPGVV